MTKTTESDLLRPTPKSLRRPDDILGKVITKLACSISLDLSLCLKVRLSKSKGHSRALKDFMRRILNFEN